jgi:hypothetical protein
MTGRSSGDTWGSHPPEFAVIPSQTLLIWSPENGPERPNRQLAAEHDENRSLLCAAEFWVQTSHGNDGQN